MSDFQNKQTEYLSQTFTDLNLAAEEISAKEFDNCTFKGCDFSEVIFNRCKFIDCHFSNCNLNMIKINYSKFLDVTFEDCRMLGIDWTKANWPNFNLYSPIKLYNCLINDCNFFGLSLNEIVIEGCKAQRVDFRNGSFANGDFSYSDLTGSLFNETNLSAVNFNEATDYHINIFNNQIKGAKFSRYQAVSLLDSLDIELLD